MRKITSLIEELKKFPEDSLTYGYEGEISGVVIVSAKLTDIGTTEILGCIYASEGNNNDEEPAEIY